MFWVIIDKNQQERNEVKLIMNAIEDADKEE